MFGRLSLKWKLILVLLSAATIAGMITYIYFPRYTGLVFLFFYIIPSNSFIPLPHEPAIIYYGKIYGPWLTTLVATAPTLVACIIDYAVLTPVFNRTRLSKIKQSGIYLKTVRYYEKAPFLTNMIAALSPVPFYPVRILSVASGYPMWKYTSAVVLGRLPRYFFLAFTGNLLNIPNWVIGFFFLSLIFAAFYKKLSSGNQKPAETLAESITMDLEAKESVPLAATNR